MTSSPMLPVLLSKLFELNFSAVFDVRLRLTEGLC